MSGADLRPWKWEVLQGLKQKKDSDVRFSAVLRTVFEMRSGHILAVGKRSGVDYEDALRHCLYLQRLRLVDLDPTCAIDPFSTSFVLSEKGLLIERDLYGLNLLS
ncbi:hypothetical protein KGO95_03735 [Patescibacteria group bacterium]|nr:hypothetical protein [Patescibacteria group bacterium]